MGELIETLQFVSGFRLTVVAGELLLLGWRNVGMVFPFTPIYSSKMEKENDRSTNHFSANYSRQFGEVK